MNFRFGSFFVLSFWLGFVLFALFMNLSNQSSVCIDGVCSEEIEESEDELLNNEDESIVTETEEKIDNNFENDPNFKIFEFHNLNESIWLGFQTMEFLQIQQKPSIISDYLEDISILSNTWNLFSSNSNSPLLSNTNLIQVNEIPGRYKLMFNKNSKMTPMFPNINYQERVETIQFNQLFSQFQDPQRFYYSRVPLNTILTNEEADNLKLLLNPPDEHSSNDLVILKEGIVISGSYELEDEFLFVLEGSIRLILTSPADLFEKLYMFPHLHPFGRHIQPNIELIRYQEFPRAEAVEWYEVIAKPGDIIFLPSLFFREYRVQENAIAVIHRRGSISSYVYHHLYQEVFPYPKGRSNIYQIHMARLYLKLLVDSLFGPKTLSDLTLNLLLNRYMKIFDLSEGPDSHVTPYRSYFATCDDTLQQLLDKFEWIQSVYDLPQLSIADMKKTIKPIVEFLVPMVHKYEIQMKCIFTNYIEDFLSFEVDPEFIPAFLNYCFMDEDGPYKIHFDNKGQKQFELLTNKEADHIQESSETENKKEEEQSQKEIL